MKDYKHQITYVDPTLIKPDQHQPRKANLEKVDALAVNIKAEGIINPIEIDENYVIITGEHRWRAALKLKFKTVPVKIFNISDPFDRFVRQVAENSNQDVMTPMESARAISKIKNELVKRGVIRLTKRGKAGYVRMTGDGTSRLRGITGWSEKRVRTLLRLAESFDNYPKPVQEYLDCPDMNYATAQEYAELPLDDVKAHDAVADLMLDPAYVGSFKALAKEIIRTLHKDASHKEEIKRILKLHRSTKETARMITGLVNAEAIKVAQENAAAVSDYLSKGDELLRAAANFQRALQNFKPEDVTEENKPYLEMAMASTVASMVGMKTRTKLMIESSETIQKTHKTIDS